MGRISLDLLEEYLRVVVIGCISKTYQPGTPHQATALVM